MKNQVLPPSATTALPTLDASPNVSNTQCVTLAEHSLPVMSEEPAPAISSVLFFSLTTFMIATVVALPPPASRTSTLSTSIQRRASVAATSALFWSSPTSTSIRLPRSLPPRSSIARRAASTAPRPVTYE